MSIRGECREDIWVPSGSVATLSWWFSVGSVLALAISIILSLSVWVKTTVGQTMALISSDKTLYIIFRLLMCPARSSVMDKIVGKFSVDSAYSESQFLPPKLAADVMSL